MHRLVGTTRPAYSWARAASNDCQVRLPSAWNNRARYVCFRGTAGKMRLSRLCFAVCERHRFGVAPRGHNGSLVDEIGKIGARKAGGQSGDLVKVHTSRQSDLGHVDLQDLHPTRTIRPVHQHLAIEPARPQQGWIEHLRSVGGAEEDHAGCWIEPVELSEQLVEGLLFLVVAAERAGASAAAERIELVDENDARRRFPRLLEQIPHASRAYAYEHLDELGARDREERHASLAGYCTRQQRLASTRRAYQQNTFRNTRAQPPERGRIAQKGDELLQFGLRLVDASHILEGDLCIGLDIYLGARLTDRHQAVETLTFRHAAKPVGPDQIEDEDRQHPGQNGGENGRRRRAGNVDAVGPKLVGELRLDADRVELFSAVRKRLLQGPLHGLLSDQHFGDLILIEELLELAVRNGVNLGEAQPKGLDQHHTKERRENVPDRKLVLALFRLLCASYRLALAWPRARWIAVSKQFQELPTRLGFFGILRWLIGHVGLRRWRQRRHSVDPPPPHEIMESQSYSFPRPKFGTDFDSPARRWVNRPPDEVREALDCVVGDTD